MVKAALPGQTKALPPREVMERWAPEQMQRILESLCATVHTYI